MNSDSVDFNMSKPTHPMYYDKDLNFSKDRAYWMSLLVFMMSALYFKNKIRCELDRWHMWDRKQNIESIPAHHVNNRGGVVVRKQFAGFEKYHKNHNELMTWTAKAYPTAFPITQ